MFFCDAVCQRAAWSKHKGLCARERAPSAAATVAPEKKPVAAAVDGNRAVATESLKHLSQLVSHIASTPAGGHKSEHLPDGTFRELLRPSAFLQHVYPGVNPADLGPDAPRTLSELFERADLSAARAEAALRAAEKGKAILASVKDKGARAGQVMDAETERHLWPQVFAEAFAREIHAIVGAKHSVSSSLLTNDGKPSSTRGSAGKAAPAAAGAPAPAASRAGAASGVVVPDSSAADAVASPFHVLAASNYVADASLAGIFAACTLTGTSNSSGSGATPAGAAASPALGGRESSAVGTAAAARGSEAVVPAAAASAAAVSPHAPAALSGGFAVQRGPFIDEDADAWRSLVLEDCVRMREEAPRWSAPAAASTTTTTTIRGSTPASTPPTSAAASTVVEADCAPGGAPLALTLTAISACSYAWLNDAECEDEFPALSELLQRLHALPYELNRKVPGLLLHKPRPGTALLRHWSARLEWRPATPAEAARAAKSTRRAPQGVVSGGSAAGGVPEGLQRAFVDVLPLGVSFLPNAPAASVDAAAGDASGGAGAGSGRTASSGGTQLSVVYAVGRTMGPAGAPDAPSSSLPESDGGAAGAGSGQHTLKATARLQFQLARARDLPASGTGVSAPTTTAIDASLGNQLLLHRTQALLARPNIRWKVALQAEAGGTSASAASVPAGSASVEFFAVCTFIPGEPDPRFFAL